MISFSGYLNDLDNDSYEGDERFCVHSCGYYKLSKNEHLHTRRPEGRRDWQVLYVLSGQGVFQVNGRDRLVGAGHIVIYPPCSSQVYHYRPGDLTEVYWMHFSGGKMPSIVSFYTPSADPVFPVTVSNEYEVLLQKIIRELQLKRKFYLDLANRMGDELLMLIARSIAEQHQSGRSHNQRMEDVMEYMHTHFQENIPVKSYAGRYNMSLSWFIRSFREQTGMSPQQYLIHIRLMKARELLEGTDYNVAEVSRLCGYENPLYFSRLFKIHLGVSPAVYRKQNK